ncbi:MAG TPA: hypothetical protein PLE10_03940 [Brevefilum sp.]|nr:hypothetical protein [Brevefilum sp.]HOR18965.1 hypothetical protein [Brevefilum sp.]HPL69356.1 hypothetical protein [Brevefilum sp.]
MQTKKPILRAIFIISGALLLAISFISLSGCNLVTPEPTLTPTWTETPTQTETPTPTIDWFPSTATPTLPAFSSPTIQPIFKDTRTGISDLLVSDDFSDERLWGIQQSPAGNIAFGTQNLTLAIARAETSLTSSSEHTLPEDFYLEITVQPSLCEPEDQIGLLFWQQSEGDFYRLLVDCAGQVRLEVIQEGVTTVLQNWGTGPGIQPGALSSNRLGLWVSRGTFHLYINDAFQFEQRVASHRQGNLGVYARTVSGCAMTVRFSDLEIFQVDPN